MINKKNFQDLIIIDSSFRIVYADLGDPSVYSIKKENLTGIHIDELFCCEDGENPLIAAASRGEYFDNYEVSVVTKAKERQLKIGCAYPIFENEKVVGAIEFFQLVYGKNHIRKIGEYANHLIYRSNNTKYLLEDIVTQDSKMLEIKDNIGKVAITDANVLIYGQTGTGKELIAQSIHNESRRFHKKFISINCGALPAGIIESLLFGTLKGSFTGAADKPGFFELAEGGTLFLDEINSLDISLQTKILKTIETKEVRRIGSLREKKVDVRIVAATNEEPYKLMREGTLKEDLFYRLSTFYIKLPRLVQRSDDIMLLADHFRTYFNKRMKIDIQPFDEKITGIFLSYDWPGNVRELRNVIESAFTFAEGNKITAEDIPRHMLKKRPLSAERDTGGYGHMPLYMKKELVENHIITQIYKRNSGNMTKTANELGISKQLLSYKMNRQG